MPKELHISAAYHHERAAKSHRAAASQSANGAHEACEQHATLACEHSTKADEASKIAARNRPLARMPYPQVLNSLRAGDDLITIDKLLAALGGCSDLTAEHLHAAKRCLLGCSREEYRFNLGQADESVVYIADKAVRAQTKEILRSLMNSR